jgi:excisionase family DNA binding protein
VDEPMLDQNLLSQLFDPVKPSLNGDKKMLSAPAAARELGTSPRKIRAWIDSGQLPAVNLALDPNGRPRYAIARADLDEFLRARRVVPRAGPPTTRKLRRRTPGNVKEFF